MATGASIMYVKELIDKKPWTGPVIDLGAGKESKFYEGYFAGHEYIRLDNAEQANARTDIIADILNMPQVKSNFYGVVLLLDVLEHLCDPFLAFHEAARILRPRGLFICTTVASWPEHKHPFDFYRFMPDGMTYLCVRTGLQPYATGYRTYGQGSGITVAVGAIKMEKQNENPHPLL